MKYDFITVGGATEDISLYTEEAKMIDNRQDILAQRLMAFEYGAKLRIDKTFSSFGGGAANAAVCLSRLGLRTASIVAIGDDERGHKIRENFRTHKVDISLLQVKPKQISGFTVFIMGKDKEHVGFSSRGTNQDLKIGNKEIAAMDRSGMVYLTSLSGSWKTLLKAIFTTKAKIAWNPGHIQLHAGFSAIGKYLRRTDVLTLNKDEAIELAMSGLKDKANTKELGRTKNLLSIIHSYGPRIVIVTDGERGADVYDGQNYYHQDVIKAKRIVDTTGVGDAFGSSFCAGLRLYEEDIAKSLYLAAKNTSSVIAKQGAQNGLLELRQIQFK